MQNREQCQPNLPAQFQNSSSVFDVNEDGLIDYSEFLEIERRYPLVLFPAFGFRTRCKNCYGGVRVA